MIYLICNTKNKYKGASCFKIIYLIYLSSYLFLLIYLFVLRKRDFVKLKFTNIFLVVFFILNVSLKNKNYVKKIQ